MRPDDLELAPGARSSVALWAWVAVAGTVSLGLQLVSSPDYRVVSALSVAFGLFALSALVWLRRLYGRPKRGAPGLALCLWLPYLLLITLGFVSSLVS